MGFVGFFAFIILLYFVYFWSKVNELKKGAGLSTKVAVRKALKSALSLAIMFIVVAISFIVYVYYQYL